MLFVCIVFSSAAAQVKNALIFYMIEIVNENVDIMQKQKSSYVSIYVWHTDKRETNMEIY